jgi:hypothetical protein
MDAWTLSQPTQQKSESLIFQARSSTLVLFFSAQLFPAAIGPGSCSANTAAPPFALFKVGCAGENGFVESFFGKLRDYLLNGEVLDTLIEAKILVEGWRKAYNPRPLGGRQPAPKADMVGKFTQGLVH